MRHRVIEGVALLSTVLIIAAGTTPAGAASACKGLEKAKCEAKSECIWIDQYTRKDGKKVSAYCKSAGKKKASSTK